MTVVDQLPSTLQKLMGLLDPSSLAGRRSQLLRPNTQEGRVIRQLITPDVLDALFANPPVGPGEMVVVPASPDGKDFLPENLVVNPSAEKVAQWLKDGYRLQIRRLETSLPEAWDLSKSISEAISTAEGERRVGINIFLVPPSVEQTAEPGARNHWDMAPMIMAQCFGRRHWRLGIPNRHAGQFDRNQDAEFYRGLDSEVASRDEVVDLQAGQLLYVPEGTLHIANQAPVTAAHLRIICHLPGTSDLPYPFPETRPAAPTSPHLPGEGPIARAIAELDAQIALSSEPLAPGASQVA